jgi:hypothetical protein
MRLHTGSAATARTIALAVTVIAAAWLVTVPAVLTTSSFLAVAGLVTAFVWVAKITYANGQPAASLAQSLHDADQLPPGRSREVK